jgi:zinc/manganese transport system permease protein
MDLAWTIMKWPLIASLLLPGILVYMGLHVVRRGVIFVDLALAQVATLGTCLCLALGHDLHDLHTYLWSVGFTLVGALVFAVTRTRDPHRVPQEALIGVVYVVAAAACIVLLSRSSEGNEELKRTLIGDVLTVTGPTVLRTFALYGVIGIVHFLFRKKFMAISFDPKRALDAGLRIRCWDFWFYALFGLVVTSFVQIGGVLLVFSYLIIPAVAANLLARGFARMMIIGWGVATLGGVLGLAASFQFDLPTGAAIVCVLGVLLLLCGLGARLVRGRAAGPRSPDQDPTRDQVI